ncbi:alpha/beta-hydrolase [Ophiobolus disseminans]|uniref:Alpha/beta-hydrolase n=1 Tax=Ophiobolus disseminans TaxID=1469910 RepID=A0A6A7AC14_9PLEO|nr:alpha/beta-hydrolase [Ophiobolus disseminans]
MASPSFVFESNHGLISVMDTTLKNDAPALLLLHGNSSSSKIFRHICESPAVTSRWRVVTFCLPGHGSSSKAPDPTKSYNMRGYAELAIQVLQRLNIESAVVLGWSLGGHIAIEMIDLLKHPDTFANSKKIELKGIMITGTPPALGRDQVLQGFSMASEGSELGLAGQRDWSEAEALAFSQNSAAAGLEKFWEPWMYEDAKGTDPRVRCVMAQNFLDGVGADQRRIVESKDVLIAVVNGAEEQFVDLAYLDNIRWKKLWRGNCMRLQGLHHAPFWEEPDAFEKVLVEFVQDAERE